MVTRRKILFAGCAACLPFVGIPTAEAHDPYLVEDLLYGVTDILIRQYIRDHYDYGHWDGGYWWRDGRRYSVIEYRNWLIDDYRRVHRYSHRPPPPPPRHDFDHRPPPPPRREFDHRAPPPPRRDFGHRPPPGPSPGPAASHRPPPPRHEGPRNYGPGRDHRLPPPRH